jgi:hypothetical protein
MPSTIRALLSETIDYAGLFPPAKLPMGEAWSRFLRHRAGDTGWLLARYVCPASRLADLAPLLDAGPLGQTPVRIAVLGSGGDDPPSFAASLENDLRAIEHFAELVGTNAAIDVFEVRLPTDGDAFHAVDFTRHQLADSPARPARLFVEVSLLGRGQDRLASTAEAVAGAAHGEASARLVGLKIRCGGLDAAAVPSVDAVAAAIAVSRDLRLPLKATQGLHHPFRRHDAALGTAVHGFVNLFTAAILAHGRDLDEPTVRRIVDEQDAAAFTLTETALGWRDLDAGFEEIVDGRSSAISSFGSCSFSEPRDDLAALGWL